MALWPAALVRGQQPPAILPGGQAEMDFQGSYLGGSSQPLAALTGSAVRFQELLPGIGLLTGNFEGYANQGSFAAGENSIELRGAPWLGQYWTVTGGDFRAPFALVELPFHNVFVPQIEGRGAKLEARHGDTQYTFFAGDQTLTAGFRVSYRLVTPQFVGGLSAVRKLSRRFQAGARVTQFAASSEAMLANPGLFPAGRTAPLVRTMAFQSLYTPAKSVRVYAEASRPVDASGSSVVSSLTGISFEKTAFSFTADYTRQGLLYFPLAGYFAGDRQGPFAETRWHPSTRLEIFASAGQYRNNLENNAALPFFSSLGTSAGAAGTLPAGFTASFTLSTVRFSERGGGLDPVATNNRQLDATLTRSAGRHTLHFDGREIRLATASEPQIQRSWEAGDNFQTRHFSLGGALREQQLAGSGARNSLFFRGLAQLNLGRFSAYANIEAGKDLASQTLFSTSAYRTSVIGGSYRVARGWNLQGELFRNSLNLALNPENLFLLENGPALAGISPIVATLGANSQWSFYFRLSKQIRWGAALPSENSGHPLVQAASLTGSIDGTVHVKALDGQRAASGITVVLDNGRTAVTGGDGRYGFENVPEGAHEVALSLVELPADYDPGEQRRASVAVQSRRSASADFEVLPLITLNGRVQGPAGADPDGIVIRLLPGTRYTTAHADGSFTFYNVREGDLIVAIDQASLPEGAFLESPVSMAVAAREAGPAAPLEFRFGIRSTEKRVRKVLEIR